MSKDTSKSAVKTDSSKGHNGRGWGPSTAVFIVLGSFIVIPTFVQIFLSFVPAILGWDESRTNAWAGDMPLSSFLFVLLTEVLTIGLLYKYSHYRHMAFRAVAALGKPRWRDIGYALLGLLVYFGIHLIALEVVELFGWGSDQRQDLGFQDSVGGVGLALAFISLVILPPIAEEIMFRGFFFGTLRRRFRLWPSVIATSSLFAALHLFGGEGSALLWTAFIDTFCLSLVLCYLREETGTIWSSMGVHFLKNGSVFLYIFIIGVS